MKVQNRGEQAVEYRHRGIGDRSGIGTAGIVCVEYGEGEIITAVGRVAAAIELALVSKRRALRARAEQTNG